MYGFSGEDSFSITGNNSRKIKIRLLGGDDKDVYINESALPKKNVLAYDYSGDKDRFKGAIKKDISDDPSINIFNRKNFKYSVLHPKASFAYNRDDGLFLGASLTYKGQGFKKRSL